MALHSRGEERTPDEDARFCTLCRKYGHPDMTIDVLAKYLRLHELGSARTDDEETDYRKLALYGFDGADLTPEKVTELKAKRDGGETLDMADTIALDAAYRRSIPEGRTRGARWRSASSGEVRRPWRGRRRGNAQRGAVALLAARALVPPAEVPNLPNMT